MHNGLMYWRVGCILPQTHWKQMDERMDSFLQLYHSDIMLSSRFIVPRMHGCSFDQSKYEVAISPSLFSKTYDCGIARSKPQTRSSRNHSASTDETSVALEFHIGFGFPTYPNLKQSEKKSQRDFKYSPWPLQTNLPCVNIEATYQFLFFPSVTC